MHDLISSTRDGKSRRQPLTARWRDPIGQLIVCGCFLVAAIFVGTSIMVGEFRERAIANSERIALKRLRYACDFFADCFPARPVRPFLRRLSALQDTLGALNDLAVAQILLGELPEDGKRVGRWLRRRERELIASLSREWSAFARMRPYWQRAEVPPAARRTPRASTSRA